MAKSSTNWRSKYERRWKSFQSAIEKAQERGYIVPPEIMDIPKARGGYKQAYERISRYDLRQIQREARAYELRQEKVSYIEPVVTYSELEEPIRYYTEPQTDPELEQLYRDTYEAYFGEPPDTVPTGMESSEDVYYLIQTKIGADSAMKWEDTRDEILYQVNDLASSFQNNYLAYKVKDALNEAIKKDRDAVVDRLTNASGEVLSELQRAVYIPYTGEIEYDSYDEASMFYGWWNEFLGGTYDEDFNDDMEL